MAVSCSDSMLARASLSFDGAELGWPELRPPSQKLPQDGPSPNRDAANWKQMVPGRLGLQEGLGRLVGTHTHTLTHTYLHTVTQRLQYTHPNTHKHKYTPTNIPSHTLTHIHSLANTTHKPAVTHSHTHTHKSHK